MEADFPVEIPGFPVELPAFPAGLAAFRDIADEVGGVADTEVRLCAVGFEVVIVGKMCCSFARLI